MALAILKVAREKAEKEEKTKEKYLSQRKKQTKTKETTQEHIENLKKKGKHTRTKCKKMTNTMPRSSSNCFVCLGLREEEEAAEIEATLLRCAECI